MNSLGTYGSRFSRFAWFITGYSVLVILWGAWVRISGSGAGCGEHWPLCQGKLLPEGENVKTLVEFSHRASTGLFGVLVLTLVLWAFRAYPKKHPVRYWATASGVFTVLEALIGAKLVLLGLVEGNDSTLRASVMALHLLNTLLLIGSLTVTAILGRRETINWSDFSSRFKRTVSLLVLIFFSIAATGAIAALSVTLFPSESILQGLREDFSANIHIVSRLRVLHPILGISIALGLWYCLARIVEGTSSQPAFRWHRYANFLLVVQVLFGASTLLSLSPVWMKIGHLLLADSLWVCIVATSLYSVLKVNEEV